MEHDAHNWTAGKVETEEMTFTGPYVQIKAEGALLFFDGCIAIVGGSNADKAIANARLIAAAPDLLEFINHWSGHHLNCDCLDEGSPRTDCTCGYDEMRDKVIAKATV